VRATLDDQEEAENPLFQHVQVCLPTNTDQSRGRCYAAADAQINHQENQLKASMISFFTSGLKRHIPQAQWSKYILAKGRWSELDVSGACCACLTAMQECVADIEGEPAHGDR